MWSVGRILPPVSELVGIGIKDRVQAQRLHRNSSLQAHRNLRPGRLSFAGGMFVTHVHKGLRATGIRIAKNGLKAGIAAGVVFCACATPAAERPSCSGGLELRLTAPQASQGSLVLAEVRSRKPLHEVTGKWADRNVYFWKENAALSASSADRRQALLGVDLGKPAGTYVLAVNGTTEAGAPASCTAKLIVVAGKSCHKRLTVEKQFVEPNQQQADRAKAEQQKLRELFDTITPERLWQGPFRMPLDGGVRGTNFGKRRVLNGQSRSPHTGADFPALTGDRGARHASRPGSAGRRIIFFGQYGDRGSWPGRVFVVWASIGHRCDHR